MIYALADLELDKGLYELRRRDQAVELAPRTFDPLLCRIGRRDRLGKTARELGMNPLPERVRRPGTHGRGSRA